MILKENIPFVHAIDLVLVLSLAGALGQVALGPLAVAGRYLLDTDAWVLPIVSINVKLIIRSASSLRAAVGELVLVVKATSLLATLEVALHAPGISLELVDPGLLGRQPLEPLVEDLRGELGQPFQTLERVSWRHLLVLGGGNGKNDG